MTTKLYNDPAEEIAENIRLVSNCQTIENPLGVEIIYKSYVKRLNVLDTKRQRLQFLHSEMQKLRIHTPGGTAKIRNEPEVPALRNIAYDAEKKKLIPNGMGRKIMCLDFCEDDMKLMGFKLILRESEVNYAPVYSKVIHISPGIVFGLEGFCGAVDHAEFSGEAEIMLADSLSDDQLACVCKKCMSAMMTRCQNGNVHYTEGDLLKRMIDAGIRKAAEKDHMFYMERQAQSADVTRQLLQIKVNELEVNPIREELSEVKSDLAETEEENRRLMNKIDDLATQLHKINDVLNHNK